MIGVKGMTFDGGCMRAECTAEEGAVWWNRSTRFFYCARCARKINGFAEGAGVKAPICVRAFRVAIVDDNAQHRELMQRNFEREGCPVLLIDHPIGASHKACEFKAEVLIVDYDMPMKGTGVLLTAGKLMPGLFLVLHSACDKEQLKVAAGEAGAHLVLLKSMDFDEVIHQVRALLK